MANALPSIPAKRYFTIGEVSELCGVKPHVLRYWEQEFSQLRPLKRKGNRRYYQHHEVLMVRRIRALLYDQGFTISGARNKLTEPSLYAIDTPSDTGMDPTPSSSEALTPSGAVLAAPSTCPHPVSTERISSGFVFQELTEIRALLSLAA